MPLMMLMGDGRSKLLCDLELQRHENVTYPSQVAYRARGRVKVTLNNWPIAI